MENLKAYIVQPDVEWCSSELNQERSENIIKTLNQPELVVFPEMFLTGFAVKDMGSAVSMNSKPVKWFQETARKYNIAMMGSLLIKDEGKYYNRMLFSDRGKELQYYDKSHLFVLSDEAKNFTSGKRRVIFETAGWKIFPQICYDLRFPDFSYNDLDYDIIVYSANWPAERIEHWEILLKARAVENQSYVLGCNRVGTDMNGIIYNGNSMIIGPGGKVLARAHEREYILDHALSADHIKEMRSRLPFLKTARPKTA
ncbi:hypothetical protein CHS0354_002009 [Potamilus streckersoni]|uniref:CN hydrolase domain-containing protein n=1 Tax=Potamilus streckersoni TaxID=2493646 RepID=A0AAE0W7D1_9BIVA|nr:hypothetical protein CHS0354_002009 [Potamilus streckersoni]